MKKKLCFLSTLILAACVTEPPAPSSVKLAETPITPQIANALVYRCKDNKEVRVVRSLKKSKTPKTANNLQLTFNNVTEKLVSTVAERGKKYTNIHWQWVELGEDAQLTTSNGAILADQCIRQ